jgi:carbon monoxide dehydrogenase subunit G
MIELERTATVEARLADVVEYLADFSHAEQWDAGTTSCERIDTGPAQVGARWHNVSKFRGKETEVEYTLVRREPQRLTFTGENKTVSTVDDLTFESEGNRTHLRYLARFTFHGMAKLAQPVVRSDLDELADLTIAKLNAVLDALPASGSVGHD